MLCEWGASGLGAACLPLSARRSKGRGWESKDLADETMDGRESGEVANSAVHRRGASPVEAWARHLRLPQHLPAHRINPRCIAVAHTPAAARASPTPHLHTPLPSISPSLFAAGSDFSIFAPPPPYP